MLWETLTTNILEIRDGQPSQYEEVSHLLAKQEALSAMYHHLRLYQLSPRSMEMVQDISELFLQPRTQLEDKHCNYH